MRTYLNINSPDPDTALLRLKESKGFPGEGFAKVQMPLLCGGKDHLLKLPVYGKNCEHIEVSSPFLLS